MYTKVFRISIIHQFHIAQTFVTSHVYKSIEMTEIFQNVMVMRRLMHMMILAALLRRSFNADSFYDRAWSSGWLSISRSRVSLWSGLSGILAVTRERSKSQRLKTSLAIISFHFQYCNRLKGHLWGMLRKETPFTSNIWSPNCNLAIFKKSSSNLEKGETPSL